ncbi:hypothetical protein ACLOJK_012510 [Asimina triloba]
MGYTMYGTPPEHGAPVWCSIIIFPNRAVLQQQLLPATTSAPRSAAGPQASASRTHHNPDADMRSHLLHPTVLLLRSDAQAALMPIAACHLELHPLHHAHKPAASPPIARPCPVVPSASTASSDDSVPSGDELATVAPSIMPPTHPDPASAVPCSMAHRRTAACTSPRPIQRSMTHLQHLYSNFVQWRPPAQHLNLQY